MEKIQLHSVLPQVFAQRNDLDSEIWKQDVTFEKGHLYLIEAESGSGKSTFCSYVLGYRHDYSGSVMFDNDVTANYKVKDWVEMRKCHISHLFQELRLFPELTALENVEIKNKITGFKTREQILKWFVHHEMEMDREHTDTWRHKLAGSNVVVGIGSTSFFNVRDILELNRLLFLIKFMDNVDFVVIEGFKSYNYPKIVTSLDVVDEYTIAEVDSFSITPEGVSDLVDTVEEKGHDIVDTLFLDECGFNDGDAIAKEIRKGTVKTEDLDKVNTFMSIDNTVIGLNEFVSDFIKKTVLGIIKTLHIEEYGVKDINKVELIINNEDNIDLNPKVEANVLINNKEISLNHHTNNFVANSVFGMINSLNTDEDARIAQIDISKINQENLKESEARLTVNNKDVEINAFVKGILKETIYGMIKSLKLGELDINEIETINITVKK